MEARRERVSSFAEKGKRAYMPVGLVINIARSDNRLSTTNYICTSNNAEYKTLACMKNLVKNKSNIK